MLRAHHWKTMSRKIIPKYNQTLHWINFFQFRMLFDFDFKKAPLCWFIPIHFWVWTFYNAGKPERSLFLKTWTWHIFCKNKSNGNLFTYFLFSGYNNLRKKEIFPNVTIIYKPKTESLSMLEKAQEASKRSGQYPHQNG